MAYKKAGQLSVPSTEFGVIPNLLKMPPDQMKRELAKTHPNTLALKLMQYPEDDVAKIAAALDPKRRKALLETLKILRGEHIKKASKASISKQLVAILSLKPFHLHYKKILTALILALLILYFSLGQLP
ncbi:hypothetical protein [Galenea microaerophila]